MSKELDNCNNINIGLRLWNAANGMDNMNTEIKRLRTIWIDSMFKLTIEFIACFQYQTAHWFVGIIHSL